jgi:hypothetical protein
VSPITSTSDSTAKSLAEPVRDKPAADIQAECSRFAMMISGVTQPATVDSRGSEDLTDISFPCGDSRTVKDSDEHRSSAVTIQDCRAEGSFETNLDVTISWAKCPVAVLKVLLP